MRSMYTSTEHYLSCGSRTKLCDIHKKHDYTDPSTEGTLFWVAQYEPNATGTSFGLLTNPFGLYEKPSRRLPVDILLQSSPTNNQGNKEALPETYNLNEQIRSFIQTEERLHFDHSTNRRAHISNKTAFRKH
jgi:hypothetical protein